MASKRESSSVIIVTGDVTMDWNIARISQQDTDSSVWNAKDWSHAYWQRGGAALVADLIEAVAHGKRDNGKPSCEVRQMDAPRKPVSPDDSRYHHSYALWSPFTYAIKPPLDKKNRVWRVEEYLGLDRAQMDSDSAPPQWKKVVNDTPDADFVILDDAGMGLRNDDLLWPQALSASRACPWILLKMTRPVAQGKLWEQLSTRCAERLIVVMTANDLRLTEVQISRELSWERTAQDLAWELVYNPQVNALSRCAHVVVSFGTAGAFLLSRVQAVKGRTPNQIVQRCSRGA
jgi:hypothetical protein